MGIFDPILPGEDESEALFNLAMQQLARQSKLRNTLIIPFLKALGLGKNIDMGKLGPVFQQMFGQELEQIGQSFGGQRTSLIDALASSGFRTGSEAAGLNRLAIGQGQSEVQAKRTALMNQLQSLFQGANLAQGTVNSFNPFALFGTSQGFLGTAAQQNPLLGLLLSGIGAGGQAAQGFFAGGGFGGGSTG